MKTIVCYGDSNTWGYDPATQKRLPLDQRWTGLMRQQLGDGYWVIEEGLNGRTTVWDDPVEGHIDGWKNGMTTLLPIVYSHHPFDLIIIKLGTNDLKLRYSVSAFDIAWSAGALVKAVLNSTAGLDGQPPKVLLVSPPPVAPLAGTPFADLFEGAEAKSQRLAEEYAKVAEQYGVPFFDAGKVVTSSPIDAIHYEPDEHRKLAEAMTARVKEILG